MANNEPVGRLATAFSPFAIGSRTLKNRFIRSATWDGMAGSQGEICPAHHRLYTDLAAGGCALLTSGYTYVSLEGRQHPGQAGLDHEQLIEPLAHLAATVHQHRALLFIQLVHCGGLADPKLSGQPAIAPSAIGHPLFPCRPTALTPADIKRLISSFASAARRAKEAGCDGIQLHAAHGYLISQFLSPALNCRRDDFGGSIRNRFRFLEECYLQVRQEVGRDFPVTIKINGQDYLDGGLTLEESMEIGQRLVELGLDAIEVSGGTKISSRKQPVIRNIDEPGKEAYFLAEAAAIQQAVDIPVITVGGIRSPQTITAIGDRKIPFIALCRPLIREPALINRWQDGDLSPARCISCNGCFKPAYQGKGIRCSRS
ncbi:MAG: NADH:flavin oxidoreductase [Deltaproteobacteria bacterium]|nr:NADH:flavin oxidoreductase [Candidatus Anaeroferrophillus wilburensis]MBN2888071.1 NADH:flavin oxidoreductase [Deltaproteobacteria bacterium]